MDELTTRRLLLRRFTSSDVELLVELDSDPAVMHRITGGRPTPRSEVEDDVLPAMVTMHERRGGYGFWAAFVHDSGEFLGWFHLRPDHGAPADEPELGYRLRRAAWGQGYATEGSIWLVDLAFRELGARRVVAQTMTVHAASRRVMEKSGLVLARTFHQSWPDKIDGDEHGDVEYALDRQQWRERLR